MYHTGHATFLYFFHHLYAFFMPVAPYCFEDLIKESLPPTEWRRVCLWEVGRYRRHAFQREAGCAAAPFVCIAPKSKIQHTSLDSDADVGEIGRNCQPWL
jgi:hypothetical protein